jgi:hypothetical protein
MGWPDEILDPAVRMELGEEAWLKQPVAKVFVMKNHKQ